MARSLKDNLISFWTQPTNSPTNQSGFTQDLVSPDEIDEYNQYTVQNPSVSTSLFGTISGALTAGAGTPVVPLSYRPDYFRNVQLTVTGGTVGGTLVYSGQDQFGGTLTGTITVGTAAAGGSAVGALIVGRIGTMTLTPITANTGTYSVGVQSGTSATIGTPIFGLPQRIGGSADIKYLNYINNGTINILPVGTTAPSSLAGTQYHTFQGTSIVAITDTYNVLFKPTKSNYGTTKQTGLGTT